MSDDNPIHACAADMLLASDMAESVDLDSPSGPDDMVRAIQAGARATGDARRIVRRHPDLVRSALDCCTACRSAAQLVLAMATNHDPRDIAHVALHASLINDVRSIVHEEDMRQIERQISLPLDFLSGSTEPSEPN